MKWNKLIPYSQNRMLHYEGDVGYTFDGATNKYTRHTIAWLPQIEFEATLVFVKWHHGRSAAYADFSDPVSGIVYPVSLASTGDFMHLLLGGSVTGRWLPVKRGNNYLLEYVGR